MGAPDSPLNVVDVIQTRRIRERESANVASVSSSLSVKYRKVPEQGLVKHEFNGGVFPSSMIGVMRSSLKGAKGGQQDKGGGARAQATPPRTTSRHKKVMHDLSLDDVASPRSTSTKPGSRKGEENGPNSTPSRAAMACHRIMRDSPMVDHKIDVWPSSRPGLKSESSLRDVGTWNNSTSTDALDLDGLVGPRLAPQSQAAQAFDWSQFSISSDQRIAQAVPTFLRQVEEFIQGELELFNLEAGDGGPHSTERKAHRLQTFSQAFDFIIDKFQTYGPLLSTIKREYEEYIQWYQSENQKVHKLHTKILKLEEKQEKEIHDVQQHASRAIREKDMLEKDVKVFSSMKANLMGDLGTLETSNRDLKESVKKLQTVRDGLILKIDRMQYEMATLNQEAVLHENEKQRIQKDTTKTVDELQSENAALKADIEMMRMETEKLKSEMSAQIKTLETSVDDLRVEAADKDMVVTDLQEKARSSTPRPPWDEIVRDGLALDFIKPKKMTSKECVGALLKEVDRLRDANTKGKRDSLTEAWSKQYFEGMGTDNTVHKFLRYNGKVRNRNMSKKDTELLVRDIWTQKEKTHKKESLSDHTFAYLKHKFGVHTTIVENGYNLYYSLQRYQDDPDIDLFYSVLTGQASEDVYYEEKKLLKDLQGVCEQVDIMQHQKLTGSISKQEFQTAVGEFYEDKAKKEIDMLWIALEKDMKGPVVKYKALFEDDKDLNQSEFAEVMRKQHLNNRKLYLSQLEDALMEVAQDDHVSIGDMRRAILQVDPAKDEDDLREMIARGTRVPYEDLFSADTFKRDGITMVPLQFFMKNLKEVTGVQRINSKRERNRVNAAVNKLFPASARATVFPGRTNSQKNV